MDRNKEYLYRSNYAELHIEHLYTVEGSITLAVFAKSYGFSGEHAFCLPKEQVVSVISELEGLYNSLSGLCRLDDSDSDAYLCIEVKNKDLIIRGQLGGSHEDNTLKFRFLADQTIIALLKDLLSIIIKTE